ncbi:hypothetical protein [Thermococcus sp.]|uniref:hypothetical protein n=1 Tax=Thermococcus sp. TaxID=35749 RepID=UPI0025D0E5EF|nr:hypothetical protein [Thermococcus sp.]
MRLERVSGVLLFIGILIMGGLLFFGFLLFALGLFVVLAFLFFGFYLYVRLKLWWARRHPPKELESPEDYF